MKLAIVTTHMYMGGIRQSLLNLMNALKEKDITIDLFVLTGDEDIIREMLQPFQIGQVAVLKKTDIYNRSLSHQQGISKKMEKIILGVSAHLIGREKTIQKCINNMCQLGEYDVAISYANGIWTNGRRNFSGGCEYVVTKKIRAKKKIAWVHSNPVNLGFTNSICRRVYDPFDLIVNVSCGCKEIYDTICPEHKDKSVVVHNLCDTEKVERLAQEENPYQKNTKLKLVTVARLDNESKRLDRIVEVCERLKESNVAFEWHLVGDGNDRALVERFISERNLGDCLIMEGQKNNPYPYMKNADLYVCTSDYEAFSMVIKEAQIVGVPTITTPISSARELVKTNLDGYILEEFSSERLAEKIIYLADNREKITEMKNHMKLYHNQYGDSLSEIETVLEV